MAAAKHCTDVINILWEILNGVAEGQVTQDSLKSWMDLSEKHLQQITSLTQLKRVSAAASETAETALQLLRCNLRLCMTSHNLETQTQINVAGWGPSQRPRLQQEQQQQLQNLENTAIKFEKSPAVTSSVSEVSMETNAATSTSSAPTTPRKSNVRLSTNGITTTPIRNTQEPPVTRLNVDSTTENHSNNNEGERSTIEEINESPRAVYWLPKKNPYELEKKYMYRITTLRDVSGPYGRCVIAHLDDEYQVFLPKDLTQAYLNDVHSYEDDKRRIIKKELYLYNDNNTITIFRKFM